MIQSMTGFGKATIVACNKKITAEIKSLNSKQMDLQVKVPLLYRELELELRNTVARELGRGKVDVYITSESIDTAGAAQLNIDMLRSYKCQVENLSQQLGLPEPDDWYATLLRMPDVFKQDLNAEVAQEELDGVREVVRHALEATVEFRNQEGEKLYHFFKEKIAAIQQLLDSIGQFEVTRTEKIKARLIEQLEQLEQVDYDKNRLEQELIFYIEKLDITEEKTRLQNHLNYFIETLDNAERQGKKLGFITQEMGREINTTGSKSNQAEMQRIVVGMKDNLEQIKEQVLNVL
ncbi:MAG: YicC family protein [Muribaculaceae bacterium]|nr:YicC family protein [Muribaculaceae bacterium]